MSFPVRLPQINDMSTVMVEECEKSNRLWTHQIEALGDVRSWFRGPRSNDIALVCMPTGSGKTGVIACLPYYLATILFDGQPRYRFDKPVLVVAPNLAIRNQLVDELTLLSPTDPFLVKTKIVSSKVCHDVLPKAMMIDSTAALKNQPNIKTNRLVITNAQKFIGEGWVDKLDDDLFRLVIVDEAHHHPAATWCRIIKKFHRPECPVVFFTATPFRTDGQRVLGQQQGGIAYHLSLDLAVDRRIIRKSDFEEVDGVGKLKLRDPARYTEGDRRFMSNMVPVLAKVKELLDVKRRTYRNAKHMAMAICKDTHQADLLLELWQSSYSNEAAECYHSQKPDYEKDRIMGKLKSNRLSLVIVVAMLLEGFDHPPISIAAITYEIKSHVRFVQFVGRAQRIYRWEGYQEPQEFSANIVTHEDCNQRENYQNFTMENLTIGKDSD